MAMFQQYQSGIQPVTGMAEAGANIGQMYGAGLANLGKGLAEGIKAYNDNSAKNELANTKIQSLSQDIANKIAMYSQDPEIAQSGVLDGLMQTAATLQDAPTKGLNQRIGIAHEAETRLAGFGQQLQEWSFLRGRQIERGISDALQKFAGTVTDTKSIDVNDPMFDVNPNETITQTKDRIYKILEDVKRLNPKTTINNDEFYARWLAKAEQEVSKTQGIDPRIISAQLEAIQAEKNIQKQNRLAQGMTATDIPSSDALDQYLPPEMQEPKMNTVKDYEAITRKPSEVPLKEYQRDVKDAFEFLGITAEDNKKKSLDAVAALDAQIKQIEGKVASGDYVPASGYKKAMGGAVGALQGAIDTYEVYAMKNVASIAKSFGTNTKITPEKAKEIVKTYTEMGQIASTVMQFGAGVGQDLVGVDLTKAEEKLIEDAYAEVVKERKAKSGYYGTTQDSPEQDKPLDKQIADLKVRRQEFLDKVKKDAETLAPKQLTQKAPTIGVGDVTVGYEEKTRPISVSERKSQVQDFLTQRFGAVDPTDPTGKRRIPVQGFDQFFAKAVPESEVREFTTDSGIRLLQINGKWEQVKAPERQSIQDIRKERIGVFGQQTADGRLVPTEFVPDSGVYLGGLYRGTDAGADKFTDEITQLIDARRGVKRLQEINDKFGEAFSLKDSGEAAVEVMNLKAALRTDIIGVGTVSNFEQALIDKVIKDPTEFLSMEPRDRAILLALANRIDRRIKNMSSSRGLTVQIRDTGSTASRYEDIRQRYLREKGLL